MAAAALIFSTTQWTQDVTQLDNLLADHQSGYTPVNIKGIRKGHWKTRSSRSKCSCKNSFGITERQHHCRRCGDIFCKECTSFQRRLNNLAHPDPNGKLYKVCRACFDQGPQETGQTRDLHSFFKQWRDALHNPNNNMFTNNGKPDTRGPINIHTECNRLKEGFRQDIKQSRLKKAAHDIKSILSNPEWLKSKNYVFENMVLQCRSCGKTFGMLRSKYHCAFCSLALCSGCLNKDVILFTGEGSSAVHIAVIKVVGCPEKEPDICMYLKACSHCKDKLEEIQINKEHENIKLDELNERMMMWKEIVEVEKKLMTIQSKIDKHLPEYQELVEALEINPSSAKALPQRKQSNTQMLAKAQGDLADHLTELVMTIHSLKKFTPTTKSQNTILRNIIKSQCEYYQENMYVFRECRRKLEELTPKEVLECIQMIVDKNAINSCYICVKQLCLEILHLSTKYQLQKDLPAQLAQLEQVLEGELKSVVQRSSEDYTQHQQIITQLLQLQLKEHRLIKSSRIQKALAANRVSQYTNEKVTSLLTQVHLQLITKVAHRSFTRSKDALEATIGRVNGTAGQKDEMDGDWTLLDKE